MGSLFAARLSMLTISCGSSGRMVEAVGRAVENKITIDPDRFSLKFCSRAQIPMRDLPTGLAHDEIVLSAVTGNLGGDDEIQIPGGRLAFH